MTTLFRKQNLLPAVILLLLTADTRAQNSCFEKQYSNVGTIHYYAVSSVIQNPDGGYLIFNKYRTNNPIVGLPVHHIKPDGTHAGAQTLLSNLSLDNAEAFMNSGTNLFTLKGNTGSFSISMVEENGAVLWSKPIVGQQQYRYKCVSGTFNPQGEIFIVAQAKHVSDTAAPVLLNVTKLHPDGNLMWNSEHIWPGDTTFEVKNTQFRTDGGISMMLIEGVFPSNYYLVQVAPDGVFSAPDVLSGNFWFGDSYALLNNGELFIGKTQSVPRVLRFFDMNGMLKKEISGDSLDFSVSDWPSCGLASDGGYIVVLRNRILKFDASYTLLWSRNIGWYYDYLVQELQDKSIFLYGGKQNGVGMGLSLWAAHTDSLGLLDCALVGTETPEAVEGVRVYPNPTSGMVHIESPDAPVLEIAVFDPTGRLSLEQRYEGNTYSCALEVQQVPAGVCYIRITTEKGTATRPLLLLPAH